MGHTIHHVCVDIRGALENPKMFINCIITDEGKTLTTIAEVKDFFYSQLEMGRRVLPFSKCEGFDYIKGCPGHYIEDDDEAV